MVYTRLLKVANYGSLRSLSFVSILQWGPQTSPQSACASFPTLAVKSTCATRVSFFLVFDLCFLELLVDVVVPIVIIMSRCLCINLYDGDIERSLSQADLDQSAGD